MNLIGLECGECADEERPDEECFTLDGEHLLDGSHVWYCDYGHVRLVPSRILHRYHDARRNRNIHLDSDWADSKDYLEPLGDGEFHRHSGYGHHRITTVHRKTTEKHRRFADFKEWKVGRDADTNNQIRGREGIEEKAH